MIWAFFFMMFVFAIAHPSRALTPLSGVALGVLPSGDYSVSGTLAIPPGETFRISAGCRLYFENFSGIVVDGTLICAGTVDSPVVLTSRNAYTGSPVAAQPFDWNGVEANPGAAEVHLKHTTIAYSTTGLKIGSSATKTTCEKVVFRNNGASTFRRAERSLLIMDNLPVSLFCRAGVDTCEMGELPQDQAKSGGKATRKEKGPRGERLRVTWRLPVRLMLGAGAAVGAGMWIGGHVSADEWNRQYRKAPSLNDADYYRERRDKAVTIRTIGVIATAVCVPAFAVTLFF